MRRAMQLTKEELANQILANPVYLPDSGMRRQVYEALLKLSYSNLSNLKTIIELKVTDCLRKHST